MQSYLRRGRVRTLPRLLSLIITAWVVFFGALPADAQTKSAEKVPTSSQKKKSTGKASKARKAPARSSRSRGQAAPATERIREIQAALGRAGFYSAEPSGKWDATTTAAMKNFQEARGLRPSGKLDAVTLQQLGLGSPVSGLAPPRPATTSGPSAER